MPRNITDHFASKKKAERTDSHSKALSLLYIELVRTLISKNVLTSDEVHKVFSDAADSSLSNGLAAIEHLYQLLTEAPDADELEDDDSETE